MTPFLELRLWWRRTTMRNRALSAGAAAVCIALIAWALVPAGHRLAATSVSTGTPGASAGAPSGSNAGGTTETTVATATSVGAGSVAGTTGHGGGSGAASSTNPRLATGTTPQGTKCLPTPPKAPGVTDSTITVGFGYANLAGAIGNSAVGLGSPQDYMNMAQAVVDDINANGGVQCRKLLFKAYEGNPINQDQTQATCVQVGQDAPLMFADGGAFVYPLGLYGCVARQNIPIITVTQLITSDIKRFSPYLASVMTDTATEMTTGVLGAQQRGYFDPGKGFKKLGLLEEDCAPEVVKQFEAALVRAHVTSISRYQFACPSGGFASPADMQQAVVQFQRDGVTNVVPLTGGGSFLSFSNAAESQRYRPKYLAVNYNGFLVTATTATKPNTDNFDGAMAITTGSYGMDTTPNYPVDAGTARCQKILVKAGFPPSEVFGPQGGGVCDVLWTSALAINHASSLTRPNILPGLFSAGPVQLAYAAVDTTYKAPSKVYGGDTWRALTFAKDCTCWHIVSDQLPSYTP